MKKNNILIVSLFFNLLISSCSQSNTESVQTDNLADEKAAKLNNEIVIANNNEPLKNSSVKNSLMKKTKESTKKKSKTLFFNGEKYLFNGDKLKKGSQVRSIHLSEKASVRGTFVVVTKVENITNVSINTKIKIAKDTFRITPTNTDDLMAVYKELVLNDSITRVELELVYSGKRNNAAEY